jgi:L-seryl-tRNA(Ser) seleniumtransferase
MPDNQDLRRQLLDKLPGMPALLNHPEIKMLRENQPTLYVNDLVRRELEAVRKMILETAEEELASLRVDQTAIIRRSLELIRRALAPSVGRAINAAGVILHTALGRAPLAPAAQAAVWEALEGYSTLAINRETGRRGDRHLHTDRLLSHLTGAEAGMIVNNNAAATMLILNTLGAGKEVIVSRGQLVEIGGSFRVPDILRESGCKLIEVGTTNRTYLRDYATAITQETAALLLVHTSNFRLIGFSAEVSVAELAALGRKHGLPVLHDIGSGALLPGLAEELKEEPVVKTSLEDGADLVLFSADKILGGPQGGIAAGRADLVEKMRRHPLYRAMRLDKLILRALETTLRLYLDPERRSETVPALKMLRRPLADIAGEAAALATRLNRAVSGLEALCVEDSSRLGSGSLPERNIPTRVVSLRHSTCSAEELAKRLRAHRPPVLTRIQEDRVLIDPRTLLPGDADAIESAVRKALG